MYANKKLFLATLQYQVYVLADDGNEVEEFTRDITEIERPTVEVEEVQSNVLKWEQNACIYHADQDDRDIKISDVFPPK